VADGQALREAANAIMAGQCACCALEVVDRLAEGADQSVLKAKPMSEMARIARLEIRTARYLRKTWAAKREAAAVAAGKLVAGGGSLKQAKSLVVNIVSSWKKEVATTYSRNLSLVYQVASRAGARRASGKTKQTLMYDLVRTSKADESDATRALRRIELMWIGEATSGVAPIVREALDDGLLLGLDRSERGKAVEALIRERLTDLKLPSGFTGSSDAYFRGLAANAVTNARVQGQLDAFSRLGVKKYEIVNPMDERTSDICRIMNGKVFIVEDAVELLDKLRKSTTPEEYRELHPWLSAKRIEELAKSGTEALAEAGQMFPPYHFFCRSTVDVSEESLLIAA
jgi:SPP1 gp7 family putative phage head morphogenesis protein